MRKNGSGITTGDSLSAIKASIFVENKSIDEFALVANTVSDNTAASAMRSNELSALSSFLPFSLRQNKRFLASDD